MILGLTIISIGIFNGLMLSFVLLRKKISNPYLGFFILAHCFTLLAFYNNYLAPPDQLLLVGIIGDISGWIIAPLLYFYVRRYQHKSFSLPFHFLPALLLLIWDTHYYVYNSGFSSTLLSFARIFQGLFYVMAIFKDIRQVKWLRTIAILFVIELVTIPFYFIFPHENFLGQLLHPLTIIFVISFIAFSSMTNSKLIVGTTPNKKRSKDQSAHQRAFEEIQQRMVNSELYLNPNIKLADLAKELKLPVKQISQAINECTGENFNLFINRYRIKAAERLLIEQSHNITIDAIAELSGFSNKVSFYKAFKKVHNISPKEYIEAKTTHG